MTALDPDDPVAKNFVKVLTIDWTCKNCPKRDTAQCLLCSRRKDLEKREEYDKKTDFYIRAANALSHTHPLTDYF